MDSTNFGGRGCDLQCLVRISEQNPGKQSIATEGPGYPRPALPVDRLIQSLLDWQCRRVILPGYYQQTGGSRPKKGWLVRNLEHAPILGEGS